MLNSRLLITFLTYPKYLASVLHRMLSVSFTALNLLQYILGKDNLASTSLLTVAVVFPSLFFLLPFSRLT